MICMDKNELQKRLLEDNEIEYKYLCELKSELDKEINKPIKKRDLNKIEELTRSIRELTDSEQSIRQRNEEGISSIMERAANERRAGRFRFRRLATALCVCFVAVIGLNIVSFHAWGTNIVSALVEIKKGTISIDFVKQKHDVIDLPTSDDDPYGIKAKCAEYDLYPETPSYLPDNFELVRIEVNQRNWIKMIAFYYKNNSTTLVLQYQYYKDEQDESSINIPSDSYNITEEMINDHTVIISKEDDQFTATYMCDDIIHVIFSINLDYDECQKIIESFE